MFWKISCTRIKKQALFEVQGNFNQYPGLIGADWENSCQTVNQKYFKKGWGKFP